MRRFTSLLVPVLLAVAVGFGAWRVLGRKPPEAGWLQVEAPRQADAGLEFPVRVTLLPDDEETGAEERAAKFVHLDLHGYTRRHEWRDCVVSAPAQPIANAAAGSRVFEFSLSIPERPDLRYVALLVYLTPNGRWKDRTDAASSLEIWYRPRPETPPLTARERIAMYPQIPGAPIERGDVLAISLVIALGWIVCGIQAWRAGWRINALGRHHRLLPLGALLAAAWELLPLERTLGAIARSIVSALHLYNMRMGFQQLVTAVVAGAAVVLVYRTFRRAETPGLRLQMIGLTVYAAVTVASFLSLHLVDAIFAQPLAGLPLLQWAQLSGMAIALAGTISRMRRKRT